MAKISLIFSLFVGLLMVGLGSSAKFDDLYQTSWAFDHVQYDGDTLKLKLDNFSGKLHLSLCMNNFFKKIRNF